MLHRYDKRSILETENLVNNKSAFLDFKAYFGDSNPFRGIIALSEVMHAYTPTLEDLFVAFCKRLKQIKNSAQSLMRHLHKAQLEINCPHLIKPSCYSCLPECKFTIV